jgi:hypothetical protein
MQKDDYSIIIFDGYFDNKEFYSDHIERECTKALELYSINSFEFFTRCLNLVDEKIKESVGDYDRLIKELNGKVNENYSKDSVDYALKRLIEVKDQIHYYLKSSQPFLEGGVRCLTLYELNLIKIEIQNRLNHAKNNSNTLEYTSKNYDRIWFQVGVAFADGRIFDLLNENIIPSEIARELFPEKSASYAVFINASLGNYKTNKNIFINYKKMKDIMGYFIFHDMPVNDIFKEKFKALG